MSKYLVSTVETYRVDSEGEVASMIEAAKRDQKFSLHKYQSEKKDVKVKGEIADSYYKVALTKLFNDIKDPDREVDVEYNLEEYPGRFPEPVKHDDEEEEANEAPAWDL